MSRIRREILCLLASLSSKRSRQHAKPSRNTNLNSVYEFSAREFHQHQTQALEGCLEEKLNWELALAVLDKWHAHHREDRTSQAKFPPGCSLTYIKSSQPLQHTG
jgi:hypothetical protein